MSGSGWGRTRKGAAQPADCRCRSLRRARPRLPHPSRRCAPVHPPLEGEGVRRHRRPPKHLHRHARLFLSLTRRFAPDGAGAPRGPRIGSGGQLALRASPGLGTYVFIATPGTQPSGHCQRTHSRSPEVGRRAAVRTLIKGSNVATSRPPVRRFLRSPPVPLQAPGFRRFSATSDIRVAARLFLQRRRLITAASPGALKRSSSAQGPVVPPGEPLGSAAPDIRPR